jgi:hypothetical protein
MEMGVCAVVGLAFGGVAEDGVRFGDFDEALGGSWVVWVAVWVVGFGEFVEGSFRGVSYDLVRRGCGLEGQCGLEKNYVYNKSNEVKKARAYFFTSL